MTKAIKEQMNQFWMQTDENGVTNLKKTDNAKVIRRVDTTDKNKSYEETEKQFTDKCCQCKRWIVNYRL